MTTEISTTPFLPQFLSNARGRTVFTSIERQLNTCNEFFMSVAFITKGGITPFLQALKELEDRGIQGKILTTDYLSFSDPDALDILNSLSNITLRMFETQREDENKGFHTKGYLFKKGEQYNVIIGSSNLTQTALFKNFEWNVHCIADESSDYVKDIRDEFQYLWESATPYSDCRNKYKDLYESHESLREKMYEVNHTDDLYNLPEIKPNKMQEIFISNLNSLFDKGENRALLISATGTGKTYASALAVKDLLTKVKHKKVLFVSHREQINQQALDSYTRIFGYSFNMGLLSGNQNNIQLAKSKDFLFATMQTLSKYDYLHAIPQDFYSIIILDECHRVGAGSYQRIINYFKPELLLGMSASPERLDGFDVFQTFDYNIAYEIRLQQALENELLCPFHYFGITDFMVDEEEHDLRDFKRLISEQRVDYILDKIKYYGHCGRLTKGLIFCSTKAEANALSAMFNERGLRTVALSGEDDQETRFKYIDRLESDDPAKHLDYIFTVDIFNEGVDIPQINQIVLLRPTQSPVIFVQQVGRGLRKYNNKEFVVILDFIGNYTNNYMIPIALSGDRSGNKDNMRRTLLDPNQALNGASTIHFDAISRQRIYKSIDTAAMNSAKVLKEGYYALKAKLGRIPDLTDFDLHGELDPLRMVKYCSSYYNFLVKYEPDYEVELTEAQNNMVDYISTKLLSGKRIQELLLLDILVNEDCDQPLRRWEDRLLNEYHIHTDSFMKRTVINVLNGTFFDIGSVKGSFGDCTFIRNDGTIHPSFLNNLRKSEDFKSIIRELIEFGIARNHSNYSSSGSFVLYQKYTYEDVCRLLNWKTNQVSTNIGGYKYDEETNTYPVFINYDKDEDISDTIKYEDRFVNPSSMIAISKGNRSIKSKDIQGIANAQKNHTPIMLFLRKNKDDKESKEFYYLGLVIPTGNFTEIVMNSGNKAVEIEYNLDHPVPDSLYEYFLME